MKEFRSLFNKYYFILPYYLAITSLYRGHRGSFLGWIWLIIKPAIQVGIYATIFPLISKINQPNYTFFLVSGILPWTFVNNSIIECSHSLISRGEVLKRCLLPRTVFPIADVIKHFILFLISFVVMYLISLSTSASFSKTIFMLPIAIIPLVLFTISCSIAISFMTPYLRDLNDIVAIMFNILFFFTPIIYPLDSLPDRIKLWFSLNPIYWLIKPIREVMYYSTIPEVHTWIISFSISFVAIILSFLIYKQLRKNIIFYL